LGGGGGGVFVVFVSLWMVCFVVLGFYKWNGQRGPLAELPWHSEKRVVKRSEGGLVGSGLGISKL